MPYKLKANKTRALEYLKMGFAVIPVRTPVMKEDGTWCCSCGDPKCNAVGKHPHINWKGIKKVTEEDVERWWTQWPDANIGILTGKISGIFVIDFDGREAVDLWNGLCSKYGIVPTTPISKNGNNTGWHMYFKYPGYPIQNSASQFAPNIDIRGDGGLIIAPGSLHKSGRPYCWVKDDKHGCLSPENTAISEAPKWVLDRLQEIQNKLNNTDLKTVNDYRSGSEIPEGMRDNFLTSVAGKMRRQGFGEEAIFQALRQENLDRCNPALDEAQVRKIAHSISKYPSDDDQFDREDLTRYPLTDTGNAERVAAIYGNNIRYYDPDKKWYLWNGTVWQNVPDSTIAGVAIDVARRFQDAVDNIPDTDSRAQSNGTGKSQKQNMAEFAIRSENASRLDATLKCLKTIEGISLKTLEVFDSNPLLFNVRNGTLNLETGEFRDHERVDMLTKIVPVMYDPKAQCPRFLEFLNEVFCNDNAMVDYIQRVIGYCLSGLTNEQVFWIFYGSGENGKGTLIDTLMLMMGEYAMQTPTSTFEVKRNHTIPDDIARLRAARFVSASETTEGRQLDVALVKQLTGQDKVAARELYGKYFEYVPQYKIFISTNHKPRIVDTTHSVWRRVKPIEFRAKFDGSKRDNNLREKLRAELPGILNWALTGYHLYQEQGFIEPESVSSNIEEYRSDMDIIGVFLAETTETDDNAEVMVSELYELYKSWCQFCGYKALSSGTFTIKLKERGLDVSERHARKKWIRGYRLTEKPWSYGDGDRAPIDYDR